MNSWQLWEMVSNKSMFVYAYVPTIMYCAKRNVHVVCKFLLSNFLASVMSVHHTVQSRILTFCYLTLQALYSVAQVEIRSQFHSVLLFNIEESYSLQCNASINCAYNIPSSTGWHSGESCGSQHSLECSCNSMWHSWKHSCDGRWCFEKFL